MIFMIYRERPSCQQDELFAVKHVYYSHYRGLHCSACIIANILVLDVLYTCGKVYLK